MKFGFLNAHNVFLMDALGALLSLLLTAGVLPLLSVWTGLQANTLYFLAIFPLLYFGFSLGCYKLPSRKPWMLLAIITANAIYVLVSATIMKMVEGITKWGYLFLLTEILVLFGVIFIEWSVYQRSFKAKAP